MKTDLLYASILCDESGNFTKVFTEYAGKLCQLMYVPDDTNPLPETGRITLTGNKTGFVYLDLVNCGTSTLVRAPRLPVCDKDGFPILFAGNGNPVPDYMHIAEQLKLEVTGGAENDEGRIYIWGES